MWELYQRTLLIHSISNVNIDFQLSYILRFGSAVILQGFLLFFFLLSNRLRTGLRFQDALQLTIAAALDFSFPIDILIS
jgi:hypothetical protein